MRNFPARAEDLADDVSRGFQQHPGRLLVNESGKSRFMTKTFWAELPAKVCLPPKWKYTDRESLLKMGPLRVA